MLFDWHWFWIIGAAILIYEWYVFHHLTTNAVKVADSGDRDAAIQELEDLARLPSLGGKFFTRYRLAYQYLLNSQYEEAMEQYRVLLKLPLLDNREADIRMWLSYALEGAGDANEAAVQRARVDKLTGEHPIDSMAAMVRGQLLERLENYEDAIEVYKVGLRHTPDHLPDLQNEFLARLAAAALPFNRPDLTIQWAEEAIENGATGKTLAAIQAAAKIARERLQQLERAEMDNSDERA